MSDGTSAVHRDFCATNEKPHVLSANCWCKPDKVPNGWRGPVPTVGEQVPAGRTQDVYTHHCHLGCASGSHGAVD